MKFCLTECWLFSDYARIEQLDRYSGEGIDDEYQDEISQRGRAEVDRQLNQQEMQMRRGRQAGAFFQMDEEEDSADNMQR